MTDTIAVVRRFQDVTDVFRAMKDKLGLTNEFCDDVGGLAKGHTDKILGPSRTKGWGPTTFDLFCELFAIEFHVRVDLDAAKRMEEVWEGRKRDLRIASEAKVGRISKKLVEAAKPLVLKEIGRIGGLKSASLLTAQQARRKGGKSRARKLSKQRRCAIARQAGIASAARRKALAALAASAAAESGDAGAVGNAGSAAVATVPANDRPK